MTKAHTPTEMSKGQSDNINNATKKFDYTAVADRLRTVSWTNLREIGLDIRTHASPKVGQDEVSGGVSVLCWHAAPVANVYGNLAQLGKKSKSVIRSRSGTV